MAVGDERTQAQAPCTCCRHRALHQRISTKKEFSSLAEESGTRSQKEIWFTFFSLQKLQAVAFGRLAVLVCVR